MYRLPPPGGGDVHMSRDFIDKIMAELTRTKANDLKLSSLTEWQLLKKIPTFAAKTETVWGRKPVAERHNWAAKTGILKRHHIAQSKALAAREDSVSKHPEFKGAKPQMAFNKIQHGHWYPSQESGQSLPHVPHTALDKKSASKTLQPVPMFDKLISVDEYEHGQQDEVKNKRVYVSAQLITEDDRARPTSDSYNFSNPTMQLTVEGISFAPSPKVHVRQDSQERKTPSKKDASSMIVRFNLCGKESIENACLSPVQQGHRPGTRFVELTFSASQRPIVSNFDCERDDLKESTKEIANIIIQHASNPGFRFRFRFRLHWDSNKKSSTSPSHITQMLDMLSDIKMTHTWPIYRLNGQPVLSWNDQVDRDELKDAGHLQHRERFIMYNDIEEFQIQQATSLEVMYMAEEDHFQTVNAHPCRQVLFYEEDRDSILAFIEVDTHQFLNDHGVMESFPRGHDLIQFSVTISNEMYGEIQVHCAGYKIANTRGLNAPLVLSLHAIKYHSIKNICHKSGDLASSMVWKRIEFIRVALSDQIPKILVAGIQLLGSFPCLQKWHPLFINHHYSPHAPTSMFDGCGLSGAEITGFISRLIAGHGNTGKRLRPDQIAALVATKRQYNHVQLLAGPSGSGKSTTAIAIIQVALLAGTNVLVISENHAAANNIQKSLEEAVQAQDIGFGAPTYPVRLYTQHHEVEHLPNPNGLLIEEDKLSKLSPA